MSNTKVQVIHQNNDLSGFGDYVPMEDGDRVIITLPDGTVDKFTFEAQPGERCAALAVIDYVPAFVPDAGTATSSSSTRQPAAVGDEYVNETGDSYNPALPEFGGNYTLQCTTARSSPSTPRPATRLRSSTATTTRSPSRAGHRKLVRPKRPVHARRGRPHHVDHQLRRPDGQLPVRLQRQPDRLHRRRRQHDAVHVLTTIRRPTT